MDKPRDKQIKALDFVRRAHARNFTDVVIAAPTGVGKSSCLAALCLWADQAGLGFPGNPGGYILCTQKMLQDQYETEIRRYSAKFKHGVSLKSASEYPCREYGKCNIGLKGKGQDFCRDAINQSCTYRLQKAAFLFSPMAITNYAYFLTDRNFSTTPIPARGLLCCDETHTLENQILGFVEVKVDIEAINDWAPSVQPVPQMSHILDFHYWMTEDYMPVVFNHIESLRVNAEGNKKRTEELEKTENHYNRTKLALQAIADNPDNWVYWQEHTDDGFISIAKPISAADFAKSMLFDASHMRVYTSAYPGPKGVFCRSLGLDPDKTAWLDLSSTFPIENRQVHMTLVGSMGQRSQETTMPSMLRMCERILKTHAHEKGLIHCVSYRVGQAIYDYLMPAFKHRLIFPKTADERNACFDRHCSSELPTVMISPSMAEGFNMADDLARFQILVKVAYPYLGDRQVQAKKDADPEWYSMQAASHVIQAVGRGVRSETDYCQNYILDSDFQNLYKRHPEFFPAWFTASFVWHGNNV